MAGFLDLSAELRIMVYDHLVWPIDQSRTDYSGFYLSCRQIKDELDAEARKAWTTFFKDANIQHCTVTGPTIKGFLVNKDLEVELTMDMKYLLEVMEGGSASVSVRKLILSPYINSIGPILKLRNLDSVIIDCGQYARGKPSLVSTVCSAILDVTDNLQTGLDDVRRIVLRSAGSLQFIFLRACLAFRTMWSGRTDDANSTVWHFCISNPQRNPSLWPTGNQPWQVTCTKQKKGEAGIKQIKHIHDKTTFHHCERVK